MPYNIKRQSCRLTFVRRNSGVVALWHPTHPAADGIGVGLRNIFVLRTWYDINKWTHYCTLSAELHVLCVHSRFETLDRHTIREPNAVERCCNIPHVGYPRCTLWPDWNFECSPRFERLFWSTRGGSFSVCFFRHRARLLRRHPGTACPAACLRARAAGVGAAMHAKPSERRRVCPLITAVLPFHNRKMVSSVSPSGAEWRNGRRRARLLIRAQRERPPRDRE